MVEDDSPMAIALQAAAELRSAAAEVGDLDGSTRRERFSEILRSAEKKLPPQQHADFYDSLERWFPAAVDSQDGAAPAAAPPADLASLTSPDALADALDPMLRNLSDRDKKTLARRLRKRLPLPSSSSSSKDVKSPLFLAPETIRRLELAPDDPAINVARLAPLLGLLIELVVNLDGTAWGVWESICSEDIPLKQEVDMKATIAAMLTGRIQLTMPQLVFQIGQLQRLIVELLPHLTKVGSYAGKHFRTISPRELENADAAEEHGFLAGNQATRCWKRYSEVWSQVEKKTQRAIDKEVAKSVWDGVNIKKY
jgi:hypothetical protein